MQSQILSIRCFAWIAPILAGLALISGAGDAMGSSNKELRVKAGFVVNFVKLTTWPSARLRSKHSPVSICVVDAVDFEAHLSFLTIGKKVQGRSLDVRHMSRTDSLRSCHVLYLGELEPEDMVKIVRGLPANAGVFTVGEQEGVASQGGVANFIWKDNRLAFQINHYAAKRQGLKIDPMLLSLGEQLD
jgi:hypothetical protein